MLEIVCEALTPPFPLMLVAVAHLKHVDHFVRCWLSSYLLAHLPSQLRLISQHIFTRQFVSMSDLDEAVILLPETNDGNIAWFQMRQSPINIVECIQIAAPEIHVLLTEVIGQG